MMKQSSCLPLLFAKIFTSAIVLVCLSQFGAAQFVPAPTPIANPADKRFEAVKEDLTSPALTTSNLQAVPSVSALLNNSPQYTVELLQVQWRFGDPLDLYVMKPKGVSKPPVILYLYGFPADTDRFKDEAFQSNATKDGFAAVGFVSALTGQRYHDRPMKEWFISNLQESLAVSAHDVQMVLNYLANRGDLDMNRVGMFGAGSGASIGILASAVDPRIKVLDTLNPWGDWPIWMKYSSFVPEDERAKYLKPEFLEKAAALDPLSWLPQIQAKNFRLQEEDFDFKTPIAAKQKLRAAVTAKATIVVYKSREDMNVVVREHRELDWIKHQLLDLPTGTQVSLAAGTQK